MKTWFLLAGVLVLIFASTCFAAPITVLPAGSGSSHHTASAVVTPTGATSVPEPKTFLLIGFGLLVLGMLGTRAMRT
jgi:hypothetical protein